MKSYLIVALITAVLASFGCRQKQKKTNDPEEGISALSIIKGQLNKIDSSFAEFIKYEKINDKTDTTYLRRDEVKKFAEPFLQQPDISGNDFNGKYKEERLIDEQQNNLSITSTLKEGEQSPVQKQIIIVDLSDISQGNVQSIYIDANKLSGDSTIEQKLFWELDKLFTIHTTVQKENQPEKTHYLKVTWQ